ncbi:MAG TPA: aldo/keto reductase [Candidatus Enterococcus stercoravium]|nr:aldo/keto reductase [Candidatus Enterococcus stercoravium]
MKSVTIGDRQVGPIGLGTWHMGDQPQIRSEEIKALQTGLDAGITVIDTAEMYGEGRSESLVGEAIQPFKREDLYLISKVYPWNASKTQLPISLDHSLKRLETDYLDLYLLHWPGDVPLEETVLALETAKAAGKIRDWGVSNFDTADMEALWRIPGGDRCVTNEVLYNLGSRGIEYDLKPWMQRQQLPVIAYSPIAQGDSLGDDFLANKLLQDIAAAHHISIFQLLLAWCIREGQTLAIPQSGSADHVLDNLKAADLVLTKAEWQALAEAYPKPTQKQPLAML